MHNPNTGELEAISPDLHSHLTRLRNEMDMIDKDEFVPIRAEHGVCSFVRGEEVSFRGGRFRISNFGKKFLRLEALPGTRMETEARDGAAH